LHQTVVGLPRVYQSEAQIVACIRDRWFQRNCTPERFQGMRKVTRLLLCQSELIPNRTRFGL
jgi:hypothetical protein